MENISLECPNPEGLKTAMEEKKEKVKDEKEEKEKKDKVKELEEKEKKDKLKEEKLKEKKDKVKELEEKEERKMEVRLLHTLISQYRPEIKTYKDCLDETNKWSKKINDEYIEYDFIMIDFKHEILSTFVPVIGIIGAYQNYNKLICDGIRLDLENLLSIQKKLIIFIKKLVLFLKIIVNKPYADYTVSECVQYFLSIRISFDPKTNDFLKNFNYGNTILYKMITLYFREYYYIVTYPLEFDELSNNKKSKLLIQTAQQNLDRRVHIHKYTCSQCNNISFGDRLHYCACKEVQFCSQDCLAIAWSTHKKVCKEYKNKCFKCNTMIDKILKCSSCKTATYCSEECQIQDWRAHKKICKKR
jgi:hypothetical protein